jgi:predicted DNA-binding protein (UPF0251 family)
MIKHETIHPYTEQGVERLLKDIYKLWDEETYGGDINATIIRVDLERALQSNALTPRQRQAVALYYFAQLTHQECAKLLGVEHSSVVRRIENACINIAMHMRGEHIKSSQYIWDVDYKMPSAHLDWWNIDVLHNSKQWWIVPDEVLSDINDLLGMPELDNDEREQQSEYTCLTERQFAHRQYKEILRPTVYPVFDNSGAYVDESGGRTRVLHREKYT